MAAFQRCIPSGGELVVPSFFVFHQILSSPPPFYMSILPSKMDSVQDWTLAWCGIVLWDRPRWAHGGSS
jgi:hypothetical protein